MTASVYADPAALYLRMLRRCVRTDTGCWEYTGSTNSRGYSQVCSGRKSKNILGHQLAVLVRGDVVPNGHNIDHRCHDSATCRDWRECRHRRCVNPAHLVVTTVGDNVRRRWQRPHISPPAVPDSGWLADLETSLGLAAS